MVTHLSCLTLISSSISNRLLTCSSSPASGGSRHGYNSPVKALLLIGGMATRLYPLSKHLPKSLLPICDRELLHYQVTQLAMAGINEIVLAAGHLVEQLREFTAGYSGGLRFHYSLEPEPRGTAGAIAEARDFLAGEPVVVLNADILSSVRIADVIAEHERRERRQDELRLYAIFPLYSLSTAVLRSK